MGWRMVRDLSGRQKCGSKDPPRPRRAARLGWPRRLALLVGLAATQPINARSAELGAETVAAFARYVRLTDLRNEAELQRGAGWLWVDGLPERERDEAYLALRRGEVKIRKLETLDGGAPVACPGGLIHHWVGAIFIPKAGVDDVLKTCRTTNITRVITRRMSSARNCWPGTGTGFGSFCDFGARRSLPWCSIPSTRCTMCAMPPDLAHGGSSAIRIAQVENAGGSRRAREAAREMTMDLCGRWRRGGGWRTGGGRSLCAKRSRRR